MDDDERVIELVGEMMTSLGCEVECARHGEQAVALYCEALENGRPYAVVVLDQTVKGGMGGEEAMGRIREIDPRAVAVVSSGYADNPVVANYGAHGFTAALSKPYMIDSLRQCLQEILRNNA